MLGLDEGVIRDARPHIGIEAEPLARGDVETLEAATLRRRDGRFEKDLGAPQGFPGAGVDPGAVAAQVHLFADLDRLDIDGRAGLLQDGESRVHDLGTDAVAMGDRDGNFCCHRRVFQYRTFSEPA